MDLILYVFRIDKDEGKLDDKRETIKQIDAGKEAAIEAEVQAARQRAIVPLEIRMKQFRDMLAEKEVGLFPCLTLIFLMLAYLFCGLMLVMLLALICFSSKESHSSCVFKVQNQPNSC